VTSSAARRHLDRGHGLAPSGTREVADVESAGVPVVAGAQPDLAGHSGLTWYDRILAEVTSLAGCVMESTLGEAPPDGTLTAVTPPRTLRSGTLGWNVGGRPIRSEKMDSSTAKWTCPPT